MAREECKALLDALSKVTACYRHLVLTVGGAADSPELREELKSSRRKAQELAGATRVRLTAALRDKSAAREERADLERLWVIFSSCLEVLESDMRRALELGQAFPLHVPKKPLIQTGLSGTTSGVAARAMSVQNMKYEARADLDVADLSDLEREVRQVSQMIYEMEMKVNVPRWTVEAKQEPGAELNSCGGVSSSLDAVSGAEAKTLCDPSRILAGIVFTAVLLVAIALAVCVAKLS